MCGMVLKGYKRASLKGVGIAGLQYLCSDPYRASLHDHVGLRAVGKGRTRTTAWWSWNPSCTLCHFKIVSGRGLIH